MPTFQVFDKAKGRLGDALLALSSNTAKCYLSNTTPDKGNDIYRSDLADIGTQNGYTTGGVTLSSVTWTEQAGSPQGIWVFDSGDFSFTASGGSIGPAQYVVLYILGSGSPNEYLIGYVDYGAPFTITDGNSLNVTVSSGFFEISGG